MRSVGYNKVAEYEDFADPELAEITRDIFRHEIRNFTPEFPKGAEYRKYWEIAMAVRALRHFGALREDARILGVGAGTEATVFYLTEHVGQVIATDLYLNPGAWGNYAPGFMLVEPEKVAPYEFDRNRLIVQHMDGRLLRYADNSFDGIFSSGSIEHFGSMDFVANSAYEMGRVLKPGGILTLSTEFRVSGPPGGDGWDGLRFFSPEALQRYIVEASGLELVDPLDVSLSPRTLESQRDFVEFANDMLNNVANHGAYPRVGEVVWSNYPHLVLYLEGYVFCSVHLALRKPDNYPATPNEWARPGTATRLAVEELNREIGSARQPDLQAEAMPLPVATPEPVAPAAVSLPEPITPLLAGQLHVPPPNLQAQATVTTRIQTFNDVLLGLQSRMVDRLPKPLGFPYRTAKRVRSLGLTLDAQARVYPVLAEYLAEIDRRLSSTDQQLAGFLDAIGRHLTSTDQQLADQSRQLADQAGKLESEKSRVAALTVQLQELLVGQTRLESAISNVVRANGQVRGQVRSLSDRHDALAQRHDALAQRLDQLDQYDVLSQRLEQQEGLASLISSRLEVMSQQVSVLQGLEQKVRVNTSYVRHLNRKLQRDQVPTNADEHNGVLSGGDLVALLTQLEFVYHPLAGTNAVDLSIQDAEEEQALVAGAAYFGDRLSSKPDIYRMPNDAWYHVDFTSAWNRGLLFENAVGKLVPGGYFVLITDAANTAAPVAARLTLVQEQEIALLAGRQVRVFVWQRRDDSTPV